MTEVFFVLTVVFIAYVFCSVTGNNKIFIQSTAPTPIEPEKPSALLPETIKKEPAKPIATKVVKPAASTKALAVKKGLKNPNTGEIATSYSNYRFTKRWIKDALVSEGFLEQVYKNAELTEAVEANIKVAISQLEALDNYKP